MTDYRTIGNYCMIHYIIPVKTLIVLWACSEQEKQERFSFTIVGDNTMSI